MAITILTRKDMEDIRNGNYGVIDTEVVKTPREELFTQLDAKGIEYKKNAKTEALEKLLEE